jgi:uncharacterized membrane protein HdeD (DUF308 family)
MIIWTISNKTKKMLTDNIQQNKNLYIFNAVMFIILGTVALMTPLIAAEFLDILIGCLLFVTGLFQGVVSYAAKRHWTYYLSTFIYIAAGVLMIFQPQAGILALAAIIAIFLLLQGIMQIFYAGVYAPFKGWGWMLASGVISIALTTLIYIGWPITAVWFLGILVGINLIFFGLSTLMIAAYAGKS